MDVRDRKDDELIRQLFCTTRIFSRTLNGCVAPLGLHSSEWMVLNFIHLNDGIAQADLIRYFKVEAAAITRTLSRLEKKGLITRVAHPNTRGKFIELTEKGAQAHRDLSSAVAEHRRKALQGLSPEMLQGLNDVMLRIQRNLSSGE